MYEVAGKPSLVLIPSETGGTIQVTAVAADKTLKSIVIPSYRGTLLAAYLDFEADNFEAGAAGNINGEQYIQIDNSDGSGYHNAIRMETSMMRSSAAAMMTNSFIAQGAIDIKAYCTPGVTLAIKWTSALTTATINIYTHKCRVNLIFK